MSDKARSWFPPLTKAVLLLLLLTSPWSLSLSHPLTIFPAPTTPSSAPPQPFSNSPLQLHNLFLPGMVLQHGVKTRVWGRGKPANGTKASLSCLGLLDQAVVVEPRPGGWQVTSVFLNCFIFCYRSNCLPKHQGNLASSQYVIFWPAYYEWNIF